jgi:NADPH2:quinone reductase
MALLWIANRPGDLDVLELVERDVAPPAAGEVTIAVRAAGVNPADHKHVASGDPASFPQPVGHEVAGVLTAVGPDTEIASGGGVVGDEVLAFRVSGGWTDELTVPARDVFAKPPSVPFEQAANLLLAGTTASEMLHVTGAAQGGTVLVHGASGAVGVSVLQQAALLGVRVVGTAGEGRFEEVRRFGGVPVAYGDGLDGHPGDRRRDASEQGLPRRRARGPGAARRGGSPGGPGGAHLPAGRSGRRGDVPARPAPGRQARAGPPLVGWRAWSSDASASPA